MVAFNSIYTNPAAYTALQSLNKVNRNLDIAQNRVASGLRVANAMDSASTYQIANGLRGEVKAIESVQASIAKFKGIVDYTLAAAEAISDLTSSLRAKFQEQADSTITVAQRNVISEEIFELVQERLNHFRPNSNYINKVILCGGGANLNNIRELASNFFKANVRIGRPIGVIDLPEIVQTPTFACLTGLLIKNIERDRVLNSKGLHLGLFSYFGKIGNWFDQNL